MLQLKLLTFVHILNIFVAQLKQLKIIIMAKPIKETPFLYGKDADVFIKENKEVKKISQEEKEEIIDDYETLMSLAEFGS
jgi:hypothetical protein